MTATNEELNSLLRLYGDAEEERERVSKMVTFYKKCYKLGVTPEDYIQEFKLLCVEEEIEANSEVLDYKPAYENGNTFWEDGHGDEFDIEDEKESTSSDDDNECLPHTLRNLRCKVRMSKYSWANLIDCEELVDDEWIPRKLVIFSDDFEFPRGLKDMKFLYEATGKYYYGTYEKVSSLWYYDADTQKTFIVYDYHGDCGITDMTEDVEITVDSDYFIHTQLEQEEIQERFEESVIDILCEKNSKIDVDSIIFRHISYTKDYMRLQSVYKFTVGYNYRK